MASSDMRLSFVWARRAPGRRRIVAPCWASDRGLVEPYGRGCRFLTVDGPCHRRGARGRFGPPVRRTLRRGMDTIAVAEAVERARRREPDGLTGLYQAFGRRVLGLCRHLLGSPEAAEDACSEVFARLPHAIDRYDP